MSGHTPGPWHASATHAGASFDIGADDNSNIALVYGPQRNGAEEYRPNACLIAAAPDLLEACRRVKAEKAPLYHDCVDNGEAECAWCAVFNAIAKAEGQS